MLYLGGNYHDKQPAFFRIARKWVQQRLAYASGD